MSSGPCTALIDAESLRSMLASGAPLVIVDAGFDLADPASGERAHLTAHLPGAAYAHLERDLSAAPTGRNGRHPLPERKTLAQRLGALEATTLLRKVMEEIDVAVFAFDGDHRLRSSG